MRIALLCCLFILLAGCRPANPSAISGIELTVGDLQSLHADVSVAGQNRVGSVRLRDGDEVKTGPAGRARVRLDDGTVLVVSENAAFSLKGTRVRLTQGRLFVQGGHVEVAVKDVVTNVADAAAGFDVRSEPKVYCARGELVVNQGGRSWHAASGETATLNGTPKVAPETAFDDWTGGLAVPWSGERGAASAIAEAWGNSRPADPGSPLVIRGEKVNVTIDGEIALTRTRTTFFNGSDSAIAADVRVALPEGAVVTHVGRAEEGSSAESMASIASGRHGNSQNGARLEWAGGGWLNGRLSTIKAGSTIDLLIDWVEWLPEKNGRATYRFPMATDGIAPMVGTLDIRIEGRSAAKWLSASTGAIVANDGIELHRADVRPTGDIVVEMVPSTVQKGAARAYVEEQPGEDPFVVVRTEAPALETAGVSLALVVDSSSSTGAALLETERAAVDAVLEALGPKDSVLVLAADQDAVVIGPNRPTSVTPELRTTIRNGLANVRASGASNLGLALERAADLLDAQDSGGTGMVVYIGDGRPTVGETDAASLKKRLARRASGVPRLGALAVGQGADHWLLSELAAGGGPVYDVLGREGAARASGALVAEALTPSLRDVSLDLGPTIDRVYPRDARTLSQASTITVAGRLRGALPDAITLKYRKGTQLAAETRALLRVNAPPFADVQRRWATERIQESVTHADGVEPAIALAKKVGLLTPWTSFSWDGSEAAPSFDRLLAMSASDTAYAAKVQPAPPPPSLLLEPPATFDGEATIEAAAEIAARHQIESAIAPMVACRDARASIKPGISSDLRIDITINQDGKTTKLNIVSSDTVLDRCIKVVVSAIPFYASGANTSFSQTLTLPQGPSSQRTQCSVSSTLPIAVRRGIWRARKQAGTIDYVTALHDCELPKWADRRAFLSIFVDGMNATTGTQLASSLTAIGETDAAAFVRQELVRQATAGTLSYEELRRLLIADEPRIDRALDKAYRAARTDDQRRAVLNRFLRLAPHSPLGRRMMLSLLESTKDRAGLLAAIDQIQGDPFADAGLLAECASALRRQGMDQEGRRAFGDLVERAPRDPWTLGYVGDRLRAEGLYEDALSAYERLNAAMPDDPAVSLRLALAHAGAGRLDVAARLLDRVAQTGGRGDDGRLGELAAVVSASLIAKARQAAPAAETDALLARRLAQTPLPDVASIVLVRTPLGDDKLEVTKDDLPADLDASAMGLSAVRIERGGGKTRLRLRRTARFAGARPVHALVTGLVLANSDRSQAKLVSREVDVPADDKGIELRWNGEVFE